MNFIGDCIRPLKNDYKHMKQDNEIDQIFRDASNVNLNEEIPSVFLSDLNSRLDALEKKRKRPVVFWWLIGVFSLSLFTWGASLLFNSTNGKPIAANTKNVEEIKPTKSKETAKSVSIQTKSEMANSVHYSTENNIENSLSYTSQIKNNWGTEKKKIGSSRLKKEDLAQIVLKTQTNLSSEQISSIQLNEKTTIELNNELSKSNTDIEKENVESEIEKETESQKPIKISCANKVRKLLQGISFGKFELPLSLKGKNF